MALNIHDLISGENLHNFVNEFHPVGAFIILEISGLIAGVHLVGAIASIAYTGFCAWLKYREHKQNINNNQKKEQ